MTPKHPVTWPTPAQVDRALALATVRDIAPGVPTTRAERVASVNKILMVSSRLEAAALIRILRQAPRAPAWVERTPEFQRRHRSAVARLQGRPDPVAAEAWFHSFLERRGLGSIEEPRKPVEISDEARHEGLRLAGLLPRAKRPTKAELTEWFETRQTEEDPIFGTVLVGTWE